MSDILGYPKFCEACQWSVMKNWELVCENKNGRFYGLPVNNVLMAPCMKYKKF